MSDVLFESRRDAGRRVDGGVGGFAEALGVLDALLDLADAAEVFVELVAVAAAGAALEGAGVVEDEVEDGALLGLAALEVFAALAGRAGARTGSNTSRGLGSGATGVVGERQDRLNW